MLGVSDLCTVLSHELRTPLTVLQGYLRLIQRGQGPADSAHVSAMLDATAQLAAMGRQASDLASWLRSERVANSAPVSLAAFIEALETAAASTVVRVTIGVAAEARGVALNPPTDVGRLVQAIVALGTAVAREAEADTTVVDVSLPAGDGLQIEARADQPRARPVDSPSAGDRPWFLAGGFGLVLVGASAVLDAHGARVIWSPSQGAASIVLPVGGRP